jgi:restriction endonuclease S subunit
VVSQSCIGLRLRPGAGISPVYLYMFLRSERGRELIDALRVGAVIPHVTPVALLEEIRVPRPSPAELKRAEKVFQSLRRIEAEIAAKLLERDRSAKTLWPIPKDETDRGPQPKSADDE